jgi:hypothetical protein
MENSILLGKIISYLEGLYSITAKRIQIQVLWELPRVTNTLGKDDKLRTRMAFCNVSFIWMSTWYSPFILHKNLYQCLKCKNLLQPGTWSGSSASLENINSYLKDFITSYGPSGGSEIDMANPIFSGRQDSEWFCVQPFNVYQFWEAQRYSCTFLTTPVFLFSCIISYQISLTTT